MYLKSLELQDQTETIEKAILISELLSECWNGKAIKNDLNDKMDKFITLMKEEKCRKLFTLAFQQYRIVGKFQLTGEGFNNVSSLVYEVLNLVYY